MKVRHRLKIALLFLVTLAFACSQTKEVNLQFSEHTPWGEETFLLPHFLEKVYSITDYGAQVKAGYNNQKNIQRTIDVCSKNGGGTVLIPEGTWQTSYLELKSNVNLQVSKGAVLSFLDSITLYSTPTFTRWGGIECMNYHPLIYAKDEKNIAISGEGKILGNGQKWWYMKALDKTSANKLYDKVLANIPPTERNCLEFSPMSYLRPPLVQLINCENVQLNEFEIGSGPFWTIHLVYCKNVVASKLNVITNGVNNDGIVPESCSKVLIKDCFFSTGDDCIVVKSGFNEDGWRVGKASERIIVKNCTTEKGHGGIVIGSEMSGGVKNLYAHDCQFSHTDIGIRVKSTKGRGGYVENLWFDNIQMDSIQHEAILLNMHYKWGSANSRNDSLPIFKKFNFSNITSTHSKYCIGINGIETMKIKDMSFSNLVMSGEYGISMNHGDNLSFDSVTITTLNQVPVRIANTENVSIQSLFCSSATDTMFVLTGDNKNIEINNSNMEDFTTPLIEEGSSNVLLK